MVWIEATREVLVTLAAVVGAVVAVMGLSTWRRQLIGNKEYDVALAILRYAYSVRDALAAVRHPFMDGGEIASAVRELGLESEADPEEARTSGMTAAYQVRWRSVTSALRDLDVARVEGEVIWGGEIKQHIQELRKHVGKLLWALQDYLTSLKSDRRDGDIEHHNEVRRTVFLQSEKGDDYSMAVEAAVRQIEEYVRPKMKRGRRAA